MSLNNNNRRLAFAAVIAVLVLTGLFILLGKTPLVIAAYGFGMVGIAELTVTLVLLTGASSRNYIVRAAFPPILVSTARAPCFAVFPSSHTSAYSK